MFILPIYAGNGDISINVFRSMLIVLNFIFMLLLILAIYQYCHDSYQGGFWDWCWDRDYKLKDYGRTFKEIKTHAGHAGIYLWIPFFAINGFALFIYLIRKVTDILDRRYEN